jgi:hypothetical protein
MRINKMNNKMKLATVGLMLGVSGLIVACDNNNSDGLDTSNEFAFSTEGPEAFTVIDRHGAVEAGTVGIAAAAGLGQAPVRDLYNASNPVEDAQGRWVSVITQSLIDLHAAIDDDLIGAGLIPASVETGLAQAGPVIVPDVIRYNPDLPTSYPNGRALTDQVVDLTIAAALLDLGQGGQNLRTLADLPLNPPSNDVEFKSSFPYLADPHLP